MKDTFTRHSRELHIVLLDDMIVETDRKTWAGHLYEDMFPVGRSLLEFVLDEDVELVKQTLSLAKASTFPIDIDFRMYREPGNIEGLSGQLIASKDNRVVLIAHVNTEDDLGIRALTNLGDLASIGVWMFNNRTEGLFWSEQVFKIHGYAEPQDITLEQALLHYDVDDRDRVEQILADVVENGTPYDYYARIHTVQGEVRYIHVRGQGTPYQEQIVQVFGYVQDVTEQEKLKRELEARNEIRSMALKGIRSGLFDHDLRTNMVTYSTHFMKMLGLPVTERQIPEEVFRSLIHPDDVDAAYEQHLHNLSKPGHQYYNAYRLRRNDGDYRYYEIFGYRKLDKERNPIRMVGNLIDVHDRVLHDRARQRNLERLTAMLNNGFTNSVLLDREARIIMADEQSKRIFRNDFGVPQVLDEHPFEEIMPEVFREGFKETFQRALQGITTIKELDRTMPDGKLQIIELIYTPIEDEDGAIQSVLMNSLDITDKRVALRKSQVAEEEARELAALKSNIINKMNHEMRTPLSGITSIVTLLEADVEMDADERKNMYEMLRSSTDRLSKTVFDLLALKDADSASSTSERLNVVDTVAMLSKRYEERAFAKQITLETELPGNPIFINGNTKQLELVVDALLNNAVRFTDAGKIKVVLQETDGNCVIGIHDTGIGVDPSAMHRIFHAFVQESDGDTRTHEGTGIGLTIARRYTELMGGTLTLASIPEKGSEFTVTLPLA